MKRVDPLDIADADDDSCYTAIVQRLGLVSERHGPWEVVDSTDRIQGWKLHVSSIPIEAVALLNRVIPLLSEERVSFKVARTPSLLRSLNEGSLGDLQIGKFLTIYPKSDLQARQLASRLIHETAGFHGPVIVTDLRLSDVIYARYGSFRPVVRQNRLGQLYPAIYDNNGRLRPDSYAVPFALPQGLSNPFIGVVDAVPICGATSTDALQLGASSRLLGHRYLLLSVLKNNPKGCVFLALDLSNQSEIGLRVLKQGRQFCLSDNLGRDIRTRLREQARLSHVLGSVISTPAAGEYFELHGHGYLPFQYLEGVTLLEAAATAGNNCAWTSLLEHDRIRLLRVMRRLARHLASMHAAGFVHRDLSPTNVLIHDDLEVSLIDLELAHTIGDPTPPFGKGTLGYISPEQEAGSEALPSQDVFGFGCLLVFLLCGCDPRLVVTGNSRELAKRLSALSGRADPPLIEVTAQCLGFSPSSRPDMSEICAFLAETHEPSVRFARKTSWRVGSCDQGSSALAQLETSIVEGVRGLLADTLRDRETGLWLSLSGDSDSASGASRYFELRRDTHHGVAGVIYALARLVRLGYIDAHAVRSDLMRATQWLLAERSAQSVNLPGLYFGEAGVAVALLEAKTSGFTIDVDEIDSVLSSSLDTAIDWLDITHGAAGQGIAAMLCEPLLPRAREAAHRFARHLVNAQEEDGSWRVPPGVDGLSGQTLSGFAHGCAGIVYFLAAYTSRSRCTDVEQAVRQGAQWLMSNAKNRDDKALEWPYSDAIPERWRWWCHGSPGIALAFLQLYKQTGDAVYADIAVRALNLHREDVRATNLSLCHGLSGLGEIYLEAATILDDSRWFRRAEAIASTLLALSISSPSGHLTWLVEDPYTSTADLMVGTAGVLHFLSRLNSKDSGLGFPLLIAS